MFQVVKKNKELITKERKFAADDITELSNNINNALKKEGVNAMSELPIIEHNMDL